MKSSLEILDVGEVHIPRPKLLVTGGNGLVGSTIDCDLRIVVNLIYGTLGSVTIYSSIVNH